MMKHSLFVFTVLFLCLASVIMAQAADAAQTLGQAAPTSPPPSPPPGEKPSGHEIITFENPNCLKWGEKPKSICIKRDPKSCIGWKHKKIPYCAKKTPFCAKFEVTAKKKCIQKKPICKEWDFKQHVKCVRKEKICSSIGQKTKQKKVYTNGKCKKWIYHKYPVCAAKKTVCWKYGSYQTPFCQNKVRKCIEKGIKKGKPECAKFATVYRRGPKFCAKFVNRNKCVQYERKKFCAKYKAVSVQKVVADEKKDIVINKKEQDQGKKCIKWKYYYPLKKVRKCTEYYREKICDIKISTEQSAKDNGTGFVPTAHQSKCLRYTFIKTPKCIKFQIVKRKVCTKKLPIRSVCVHYQRPIISKKICVAYKTPYKFYCKKHAVFCNDFGKNNKHYCKAQKEVCKKYKFEKKKVYCLHHHRVAEWKTVKYPVCNYTKQCVEQKSFVTRSCKVKGHKCVNFKLYKRKRCAKTEKKCTKIAYRTGKKYCAKHKKGSCREHGTVNKKVCLEWKHKKHHPHPKEQPKTPAQAPSV